MSEQSKQRVTCPACNGLHDADNPCFICNETGTLAVGEWLKYTLETASRKLAVDTVAMHRRLIDAAYKTGEEKLDWNGLAAQAEMTVDQFTRSRQGEQADATLADLSSLTTASIMGLLAYVVPDAYKAIQAAIDPTYKADEIIILTPVKTPKASKKVGLAQGEHPDIPF